MSAGRRSLPHREVVPALATLTAWPLRRVRLVGVRTVVVVCQLVPYRTKKSTRVHRSGGVGGCGETCELVRRARHPCAPARPAAPRSPRPRGSTKYGLAALRAARAPCVAGPWSRPENAVRSAPLGGIGRPAPRVRTRHAMRAGPRDAVRRAEPGSRLSEQPAPAGRQAWIHRATARCRPGLDEHCRLTGGRPLGPPIFSHKREGFRHAMRRSRHSTGQLSRTVITARSGCARGRLREPATSSDTPHAFGHE